MLMPSEKCSDSSSESVDMYKARIMSIRILYFTVFLGSVCFSIVMPSIWPYLQVLTSKATTTFLGIVVASFCAGQFVMSPPLGFLANRLQKSKLPILIGLSFQISGNFTWSYLQDLPSLDGYMMVIARFLTGIGSANMAVIRSYISKATTLRERTGVNAIIAACMALGFCVGPGLQASLVGLGYPGPIETKVFRLNMFTAPAWIGIVLGGINMMAIALAFQESDVPDDPVTETQINAEIIYNNTSSTDTLTDENPVTDNANTVAPDYIVVVVLLIGFFVLFFLFTMVETMTTPLSMYELAWTKYQATMYGGIMWLCSGILSIIVVMIMRGPLSRIPERLAMVTGYVFIMLAFLVFIPYPGEGPKILWMNKTSVNTTDGGCPSTLSWCLTEPRMYLLQFIGCTCFLSIGFPVVNLLISTMYSKVLGPIPQGVWMGVLTSASSFSRILGSIFVGASLERLGPRITILTVAGMTLLMWGVMVAVYRRLVPYAVRVRKLLETNAL